MTDPMVEKLQALADRCEKATGPDAQLETDIQLAVDPNAGCKRCCGLSPAYTRSLDAAMSLANDFGGEVTFFKNGRAKAFLWQPYPIGIEAKAATPALALCAAVLRARAEQGGTQ
jgi:hypothetical protein